MAKQKELAEQEGFSCEPYPAESYEPSAIVFKDRRIYAHRIIRIKYTTYDVRRHEDVVHVDSDVCNIMLPNQAFIKDPKAPPYKYGRVLGIYHAHVSYTGEIAPGGVRYLKPMKMEFLLVRWYDHIPSDEGAQVAMDRLRLPEITSPDATQFIDPSTVLRAAHVIPRFSLGPEYGEGRGISEMGRDSSDWKEYFVNRYDLCSLRAIRELTAGRTSDMRTETCICAIELVSHQDTLESGLLSWLCESCGHGERPDVGELRERPHSSRVTAKEMEKRTAVIMPRITRETEKRAARMLKRTRVVKRATVILTATTVAIRIMRTTWT